MGHVDGNSAIVSFHDNVWLKDSDTTWLLLTNWRKDVDGGRSGLFIA